MDKFVYKLSVGAVVLFYCLTDCSVSIGISNLPTILKATERLLETSSSLLIDRDDILNSESMFNPGLINKWKNLQELPVEVPIPDIAKFHSIFTCPVSKQSSSPENPPVRISCGHVLSKEAVGKLSRGFAVKFKCPYCPIECDPQSSLELFF